MAEDNKVILISTYNNSSTVNYVINLQLPFPVQLDSLIYIVCN